MNLIDVTKQFPTDDEYLKYIEQMRWPDGSISRTLVSIRTRSE